MMSINRVAFMTLLLAIITSTEALECRILLNDTSKDLGQIITTCLIPTIPVVEVTTEAVILETNITHDDDPEDPLAYGPRRGLRIRRDNDNKTVTTPKTTSAAPPSPAKGNNNNGNNETGEGTEANNDPARCVVHCIMTSYNMVGPKGYPELKKVTASLIKDAMSREMKDFLQDSVDSCFLQQSENVDLDICTYSARLATCLADKARFNCVDFPVGELPFPHKF